MQRCGLEIERVQFESLLQTGPGGYMRRNYYRGPESQLVSGPPRCARCKYIPRSLKGLDEKCFLKEAVLKGNDLNTGHASSNLIY